MFTIQDGVKINPEWQKHADLYNEGAEGYNPHQKWLPKFKKVSTRQIGRDVYTYEEAKTMLKKLKESLPKHTDPKKIAGCSECIHLFECALKERV